MRENNRGAEALFAAALVSPMVGIAAAYETSNHGSEHHTVATSLVELNQAAAAGSPISIDLTTNNVTVMEGVQTMTFTYNNDNGGTWTNPINQEVLTPDNLVVTIKELINTAE